ncbi:sugar ABC transporter permease [Halalkalicoccus jeotgali B3]|uniref:Binding-protein-dependent transport systems inner membrane component n=2 Tax=Halalkalicoccus jeotgali TaxID=413810 RepID=D8J2D8_HALJB|nr:binding-protein-dependent transport systems inner membrane component [Halalkalicoccus jeotgali B3]ELY39477.1 sugar ABC transporter permease [Halalkalicoccus jeotgali B3]
MRGKRRVRADGGATESRSTARRWLDSDIVQSAPFWGPPFLLMGFFVYAAIGWNFVLSLTDYSGFGGADYSNLNFENYRLMLEDPAMWEATRNTFVLLVVFTVTCLLVGLGLAILLDRQVRFGRGFRTIYLLPFALSFIVTAQFWRWMYNVNDGIVNQFVGIFGLGPYNWLGNPQIVLGAVIFALVWQFSGYTMVIYLAALRSIPTDQYEAARVDGAGTLRMYRRVIVPQLRPAMVSASVTLVLFALKAFDFLYAVFGGYRPRQGADILATKMVREAFGQSEWAYGSAIAIALFVLSLAVIAPYLYSQYTRGNL